MTTTDDRFADLHDPNAISPLRPRIRRMEPVELELNCAADGEASHIIVLKRSGDLFLACKAVDEPGEDEGGTVLLRLGIDGYIDRVIVNPTKIADMTEVLRQARDAIAVALDGLDRLR